MLAGGLALTGVTPATGSPRQADPRPIARVESGLLRGTSVESPGLGRVEVFRSIPFAATPVGDLRWRAPRRAPSWPEVRDATVSGPACPQEVFPPRPTSEDCLTLEVWTPAAARRPTPVVVWLHGGGYVNGAGSDYDASRMAALGGVTVVTDARFACPGLRISELAADGNRSYLYEFADRTAPASVPFPTDIPRGAAHASELPYLFDLGPVVVPLSTQQRTLGDEMIRYWSRFARTHRPGSPGDQPRWPALRDRHPSLAVFGSAGTSIGQVADFSRIHRCDFWARTESLPLPSAAPPPGDGRVT